MYSIEQDDLESWPELGGVDSRTGLFCVAKALDTLYVWKFVPWLKDIMDDMYQMGMEPCSREVQALLEDDFGFDCFSTYFDSGSPLSSYDSCVALASSDDPEKYQAIAEKVYPRLFDKLKIGQKSTCDKNKQLIYARRGSETPLMHPNIEAYMRNHEEFSPGQLEEILEEEEGLTRISSCRGEIVLCWAYCAPDENLQFPKPDDSFYQSHPDDWESWLA